MHRKPILAAALAALAVLATAGPAAAHVTVQPDTATAGEYTVIDVRVPNESDEASTKTIALQMPPGFAAASFQPVPGWEVTVKKEKLATPIETDDGQITEGVTQVTWTGGRIPPGGFQDFPLSVLMPDKAQTLTFKAVQTYTDGEVSRWIGAPDSDEPAPTVKLTTAAAGEEAGHGGGEDHAAAATGGEDAEPAAAAEGSAAAADEGHEEKASEHETDGLAVAALIVGGLGVLLGAAGLASGRRRSTPA
ncbi:putative protein YcnI [Paraconexibacter sp. AEG42_29]|uniref:YncI copper-binding domain-containing protein n=1 Tax=Paraconexibacter sp. AEG42_29 TaxID=2997339 RepID=A0AAU7AQ42_9ACTN